MGALSAHYSLDYKGTSRKHRTQLAMNFRTIFGSRDRPVDESLECSARPRVAAVVGADHGLGLKRRLTRNPVVIRVQSVDG